MCKNADRYKDGIIFGVAAGAPVNDVTTVIDDAEFDGEYWYIKGHELNQYDNIDMYDRSFSAVMAISQTENGQVYWSIYSFDRD